MGKSGVTEGAGGRRGRERRLSGGVVIVVVVKVARGVEVAVAWVAIVVLVVALE